VCVCVCVCVCIVRFLLIGGADTTLQNNTGDTPLINTIRRGDELLAELIIDKSTASLHRCNEKGHNALMIASKNGLTRTVLVY